MIHDIIVADASASSGKNAKVKAAAKALEKLTGLAPYEFRKAYECQCEGVRGREIEEVGGQGVVEEVGTAI